MTKFFAGSGIAQSPEQGPLDVIIPTYAAFLSQQGYSKLSARQQLRFLADMNRWLRQKRLQVTDLSEPTIKRYMRSRHGRLRPRRDDAAILNRLVHLLHTHGLLPQKATRLPDNPHQYIDNDFDHYLSEDRGLCLATRINYRPFIQKFLSARFGNKPARFAELNASDVTRFIRNQAPRLNPKCAGLMVTALRSFFRYLRHRGDITVDLAACVPAIANWQFSTLPKFLQPDQVQQVLSRCDRRTAQGRRDYAILLLLARLACGPVKSSA